MTARYHVAVFRSHDGVHIYMDPWDGATSPRYRYVNRLYYAHGAPHGVYCDPVRRGDGRCTVGTRHALVRFSDGYEAIVIRRCLRLADKPK